MSMITWQPSCCVWHGNYAEHELVGGGNARLKTRPESPGKVFVCRFGPDNKGIDLDGDGIPDYVEMDEADALALLV